MPEVSMPYGLRDERLVHVRDLTEAEHGAAARCICPQCREPVLARWGKVVTPHFSHTASSCSPNVMSLVHRFAQEFISRQSHLDLPPFRTELRASARGRDHAMAFERPGKRMRIVAADVEKSVNTRLRTDVWLQGEAGPDPDASSRDLAVEVCFRHAVDEAKREHIASTHCSWIEFDISDLDPDCVSDAEMARAVGDPRRWTWLHYSGVRLAGIYFEEDIAWHASEFVPARPAVIPRVHRTKPFRKLQEAERKLDWAKAALQERRSLKRTAADNVDWMSSLSEPQRLAVCGVTTGLPLEWLPTHFYQVVDWPKPSGIKSHAWTWQLPIWAKFARRETDFTSLQAAVWLKAVLGDRQARNEHETSNGYSRLAATVHNFLLNLTAQGLLVSTPHVRPAERTFRRAPDAAAQLEQAVDLTIANGH